MGGQYVECISDIRRKMDWNYHTLSLSDTVATGDVKMVTNMYLNIFSTG